MFVYDVFKCILFITKHLYNFRATLHCVSTTGILDEYVHLLLPALIRLLKVDASADIRRSTIKTLIRLIPRVQVCS